MSYTVSLPALRSRYGCCPEGRSACLDRRVKGMGAVTSCVQRGLHRRYHLSLNLPGGESLAPGQSEIGLLPLTKASVVVLVEDNLLRGPVRLKVQLRHKQRGEHEAERR